PGHEQSSIWTSCIFLCIVTSGQLVHIFYCLRTRDHRPRQEGDLPGVPPRTFQIRRGHDPDVGAARATPLTRRLPTFSFSQRREAGAHPLSPTTYTRRLRMIRMRSALSALALLVLAAPPAVAHHGGTGDYEASRPLYIAGEVVEARYTAPHGLVTVRVPSDLQVPQELPGTEELRGYEHWDGRPQDRKSTRLNSSHV